MKKRLPHPEARALADLLGHPSVVVTARLVDGECAVDGATNSSTPAMLGACVNTLFAMAKQLAAARPDFPVIEEFVAAAGLHPISKQSRYEEVE